MEYLLGIIALLTGGLFYYRNKAQKESAKSKVAETRGRDKELQITQEEIEEQIKKMDAGIDKLKERKLKRINDRKNMTLAERAKEAKERYKK